MFGKITLQLGLKFLSIFFSLLISRWLITNFDASVFKDYTVITAFNGIVLMAITFGIPTIVQKYYTKYTDSSELGDFWATVTGFRLITFLIGLILLWLLYPFIGSANIQAIFLLYVAQFILLADNSYRSIVDSQNRSWQFSMTDLVGKGLLFGFVVLVAVWFKLNLVCFALLSIAAYGIAFVCDIIWQKKHTPKGKFHLSLFKVEMRAIGFLTLAEMVTALYLKTDVPFLSYLKFSDSNIVSYASAYKLFEIATVIPGLMMPVIASKVKREMVAKVETGNLVKEFAKAFGLGLVLFGLALLLAPVGSWLIDPKNLYPDITTYFKWLSPILILLFPVILANDLINLSGLEKMQLWSKVITAIFVILAYIVLIPTYGPAGAILATIGGFVVELVVKGWIVFRYVK